MEALDGDPVHRDLTDKNQVVLFLYLRGVESIAGPSRLPDLRTATTTGGSRMEVSGRDNQTRQTRATTRGRNKQAEKPVRSNQATTRRPCPYYLRSRIQENDGILRS
ncbi:hypothetical protein TNCV_1318101 [Trichonephila clavipes]|nr:hypothetical protein TNCV_1318101 [Trichonephila clavipes]